MTRVKVCMLCGEWILKLFKHHAAFDLNFSDFRQYFPLVCSVENKNNLKCLLLRTLDAIRMSFNFQMLFRLTHIILNKHVKKHIKCSLYREFLLMMIIIKNLNIDGIEISNNSFHSFPSLKFMIILVLLHTYCSHFYVFFLMKKETMKMQATNQLTKTFGILSDIPIKFLLSFPEEEQKRNLLIKL